MTGRVVSAAVLLVVEVGLALLAVLVHHGFTAVYGTVTDTAFEGLAWGLTAGPAGMALGLVAVVAVFGLMLSPRLWMRLRAGAIPVLMLLGMLAVTPLALGQKAEKFASAPQCVTEGSDEPMATADRESQQAFDSIEHIGLYSGGGVSGLGGCARWFEISEDVDVLQHYCAALPEAGWEVANDDGRHLLAQRNGLAFEVMSCPGGGAIWTGNEDDPAFGQGTAVQPVLTFVHTTSETAPRTVSTPSGVSVRSSRVPNRHKGPHDGINGCEHVCLRVYSYPVDDHAVAQCGDGGRRRHGISRSEALRCGFDEGPEVRASGE